MQIILLQDVAKVGRKYEVKEVHDGFARNFLLGQGKAVPATPANLAKFGQLQKVKSNQTAKSLSSAGQLVEALKDKALIIKAKANPEGHLFAALHEKEIQAEIKKQFNLDLPLSWLSLEKPIKQLGENKIALKSGLPTGQAGDQVSKISVTVEAN